MKEKIQLLAAALALILLLCGCAARGTASNDAKPAAGDVTDSNAAVSYTHLDVYKRQSIT